MKKEKRKMVKIALTNLQKYNEGSLVYTWLELPTTNDEIRAAFEKIGCIDGDHFISDYEAPFEIHENISVYDLNDILSELSELDSIESIFSGKYNAHNVINFAFELEDSGILPYAEEFINCIISDEIVRYNVQEMAKEGDFWRICFYTENITKPADYYFLDGDGNCRDLQQDDLNDIVSGIMSELIR